MGLGKTVQIVTFLDHLFEIEKIRGPFLICVPLSTIEHVSASPHTRTRTTWLGLAWLGLACLRLFECFIASILLSRVVYSVHI